MALIDACLCLRVSLSAVSKSVLVIPMCLCANSGKCEESIRQAHSKGMAQVRGDEGRLAVRAEWEG